MHSEETIRSYHLCFQGIVLEMQVLSGAALGFAEKKKNLTLVAATNLQPRPLLQKREG